MRKILITGGTVFVSRYLAEYYVAKGDDVYVINRNTRKQSKGVTLLEADRHRLGDLLRSYYFDVVIDTAYTCEDITMLLDSLGGYREYIFISSSAVYPESSIQPFQEDGVLSENKYWGIYGVNKIKAEKALLERNSHAYILRPPYLYGPMNNVYREAFVFDCALTNRKFYLPGNGEMKLQFFYIRDLCRFIDVLLEKKPNQHVFNVGNKEVVSIRDWVDICYSIVGKTVEFINVDKKIEQRNYFSFYDYEYYLDVSRQYELMAEVQSLEEGLKSSFEWYMSHEKEVNKKAFIKYIDNHFV